MKNTWVWESENLPRMQWLLSALAPMLHSIPLRESRQVIQVLDYALLTACYESILDDTRPITWHIEGNRAYISNTPLHTPEIHEPWEKET